MGLKIGGFDVTDVVASGTIVETPHSPWEITAEQDDGGNWFVAVRPGSVNGLVPKNIFKKFDVSAGTYHVKLRCDGGNFGINNCEVVVGTSPAIPNQATENTPPPQFWLTLGLVVLSNDGGSNQLSADVIQIQSVNVDLTAQIAFIETKTPTTPGTEPFTRWWKWSVSFLY